MLVPGKAEDNITYSIHAPPLRCKCVLLTQGHLQLILIADLTGVINQTRYEEY